MFRSKAVLALSVVASLVSSNAGNAAVISGTSAENYVTLYGPERTFAPLSGTKTKTETFAVHPAPSTGELIVTNGSGEDLSAKNCNSLGLIAKLVCVATNVVNAVRLDLERPSSVEIRLNGALVVAPSQLPKTVNTLNVPVNLTSSNQLVLKIKGSILSSVSIHIRGLDHTPPVLQLAKPTQNQVIQSMTVAVQGSSNKPLSLVRAKIGTSAEVPMTLSSNGLSFEGSLTASMNGPQVVTVVGRDPAGNEATVTRNVTIQYNRRPEASLQLASSGTGVGPLVVLFDASGSVDPDGDALTFIYDFDDGETLTSTSPKISHEFKTTGEFDVEVTVRDPAGLSSKAEVTVTVTVPVLPPKPEDVAPVLVQNQVQSIESMVSFLYTGPNPIQKEVNAEALESSLVSLIRGEVLDDEGLPLSGARVSILGKPELGYTLSRADGKFDLVANAGGPLTIQITRNGYLAISRSIVTSIQEMYVVDSARMTRIDSKVSRLMPSSPLVQVLEASPVVDGSGERTARLVVPRDTVANLRMSDGTSRAVQDLSVRMTEYTVGDFGVEKMPAPLPARTAYTYAISLQADEATVSSATSVEFSKPISFYVDNFLNIRPGIAVPLGYLNKQTGFWEAQPDGLVIRVLGAADGIASLDLGLGRGATEQELLQIGIDEDELGEIAKLYGAGRSFWRIQTTHFSDFDLNFNGSSVEDLSHAAFANTEPPASVSCPGCEIDLGSLNVKETIDLPGTDFRLSYTTSKSGYRNATSSFTASIFGTSVPSDITHAVVNIDVAGRRYVRHIAPVPESNIEFQWDGKDVYGREVNAVILAQVDVQYHYVNQYTLTPFIPGERSFGTYNSGVTFEEAPGRGGLVISNALQFSLRPPQDLATRLAIEEIGRWTFDKHHFWDRSANEIHFGDGSLRKLSDLPKVVKHVAGNGTVGYSGDGGPAAIATLSQPRNIKIDNYGNILIAEPGSNRIRRINRFNGNIHTIAGTGAAGFSGDGGLAINARLNQPHDLFVDRDDNIYFTDYLNHRVRQITKSGLIRTVAGTGVPGYSGDGGRAVDAQIRTPRGIVKNKDGSLYFSENDNHTIRRVDPSGYISTIAGTGVRGHSGDGGLATEAEFNYPNYTAFDSVGNLYVAESGTCSLRRISPWGTVSTVAGTGVCGFSGDYGLAKAAQLSDIAAIAVGADNTVYIADRSSNRIRKIDGAGYIHTVIGTGSPVYNGEGRTGLETNLNYPTDVEVRSDGSLVIADFGNSTIREFVKPSGLATSIASEIQFASEDGSEFYVFDRYSGRHLRTRFGRTGATKYLFEYDSNGLLVAIGDANNNRTLISRDGVGLPYEIVTPRGRVLSVSVDSNGGLTRLAYPSGETYRIGYNGAGLLTSFKKPSGAENRFEYDSIGRVFRDFDAGGGVQEFNSPSVRKRVRTTLAGDKTEMNISVDAHGNSDILIQRGFSYDSVKEWDNGNSEILDSSGTKTQVYFSTDQRTQGLSSFPSYSNVILPDGTTSQVSVSRNYNYGLASASLFNFDSVESIWNGRTTVRSSYSSSSRTLTVSSDVGVAASVALDAQERPIQIQTGGLNPVSISYLGSGEIESYTQGSRTTQFSYDSNGYLSGVRDASGVYRTYVNDTSGKVKSTTSALGHTVNFTHDLNGNLNGVVLPGNILHIIGVSLMDFFAGYSAPNSRSVSREYDLDQNLTRITRADGRMIEYNFNFVAPGRREIASIDQDGESVTLNYNQFNISGVASGGEAIEYGFVGKLRVSKSYSPSGDAFSIGVGSGLVPDRVSVKSGTESVSLPVQVDANSNVVAIGNMTYTRNNGNGAIGQIVLNNVDERISQNLYGETVTKSLMIGSDLKFAETFARDNSGRIVAKESIGVAAARESYYVFDSSGRLSAVTHGRFSPTTTKYTYDDRGNRIAVERDGLVSSAVFDSSDRIVSDGDWRFIHSDDGELLERRHLVTGVAAAYAYNSLSQLVEANLSGGNVIGYEVDPEGHRRTRKKNGAITHRYVYDFAGRLVGELRSDGRSSQFFYGSESHSPDMMIRNGVEYRIVLDQVGSVRAVINTTNGNIAQEMVHDEFGRVLLDTSPGFQPFGFAGGVYDSETKLVKFGAREYDPELGRWLTRDPILFAGGDVNLYRYVANDPVNYFDPNGERLEVGSQRGSMAEIALIWKAIGKLRKSGGYGEKIYQWLQASETTYTIWAACGAYQSRGTVRDGNQIYLNLLNADNAFFTFVATDGKRHQVSLERLIAHEMAHLLPGVNRSEKLAVRMENAIVAPFDSRKRKEP